MDEDITEKEALLLLLLQMCRRRQKHKTKRKKPRFWVRDIFREREQYGECGRLVQKLILGVFAYFSYWLQTYIALCALFSFVLRRSLESQPSYCKRRKNSFV